MRAILVVILLEACKPSVQIKRTLEYDVVKKIPANGTDESPNEEMQAEYIEVSPNNLQLRDHRLVQQIDGLLEPLILDECRISSLSCLDRSMAEKMLHVSYGSTPTQ
jgi:hypothetical protein